MIINRKICTHKAEIFLVPYLKGSSSCSMRREFRSGSSTSTALLIAPTLLECALVKAAPAAPFPPIGGCLRPAGSVLLATLEGLLFKRSKDLDDFGGAGGGRPTFSFMAEACFFCTGALRGAASFLFFEKVFLAIGGSLTGREIVSTELGFEVGSLDTPLR